MILGLPPYYSVNRDEIYIKKQYLEVEIPQQLPEPVRDLLQKLLTRDASKRLGVIGDIKEHIFFKGYDWSKLLNKELKAPFRPLLEGETDIKYFNLQFEESPESYEE